jgi:hypothetical protein
LPTAELEQDLSEHFEHHATRPSSAPWVCQPSVSRELCWHVTRHQILRPQPGRADALRTQPATPADALHQWAFCSFTTSPGARACYDTFRGRGETHNQVLSQRLADRWAGVLQTCLDRGQPYDENIASDPP